MDIQDETLDRLSNILRMQHQTIDTLAAAVRRLTEDVYQIRRDLQDHHTDSSRDHDDHDRKLGEVRSAVKGTAEDLEDKLEDISDQHILHDPAEDEIPIARGLSWKRVASVSRWLLPFLLAGSLGAGARDLIANLIGEGKPPAQPSTTHP